MAVVVSPQQLLCAGCGKPFGPEETQVRQAVLDLDGQAKKGEFEAYCVDCFDRLGAREEETEEAR